MTDKWYCQFARYSPLNLMDLLSEVVVQRPYVSVQNCQEQCYLEFAWMTLLFRLFPWYAPNWCTVVFRVKAKWIILLCRWILIVVEFVNTFTLMPLCIQTGKYVRYSTNCVRHAVIGNLGNILSAVATPLYDYMYNCRWGEGSYARSRSYIRSRAHISGSCSECNKVCIPEARVRTA